MSSESIVDNIASYVRERTYSYSYAKYELNSDSIVGGARADFPR